MSLLMTFLKDLEDEDIRAVVYDLCNMAQQAPGEHGDQYLFHFLQTMMGRPAKLLSLDYLATPSVLGTKLEKLQSHGFCAVCSELEKGGSLEPYDRMTLLSYLRKRAPKIRPTAPPKSAKAKRSEAVTAQRRANRR